VIILGINSVWHESAACIIKDGKIIAAIEEEKLNRKKHAKQVRVDNPDELPEKAITYCLEQISKLEKRIVRLNDIDYIGYSFNPRKRLDFHLQYKHPYKIKNGFGNIKDEKMFFEKTMHVETIFRKKGFDGKFLFIDHHDCHAASSFLVSPFTSAAIMVIDGIGGFETTTLYHGESNNIRQILSLNYPNSLGFLWEKFSKFLGFNEYDASKVMGLASYGSASIYEKEFKEIVKINDDGTFSIDDNIMKFRIEDYSELTKLFKMDKKNNPVAVVNKSTQKQVDIAAALQSITEEIVIKLARVLKEKTGEKYLCMAGGVALNCTLNGKLIKQEIFEDIFIQPAAHDAGTAIGAAYNIWNRVLGQKRCYSFNSPYFGFSANERKIEKILTSKGLEFNKQENIEEHTAELIAAGNIVAWFQGQIELGPRALGNRSILADPRKKYMVAELNFKVKKREPFRPFCPSVLEEKAHEWFEINKIMHPAKYMLAVFDVLPYRKEIIPAVVHIDGTSRIQVVEKITNPRYYELIKSFENITGVPILLNTSFNVQEPMVCTPTNAINTFLRTKIDYLIIEHFVIPRVGNIISKYGSDLSLKEYFEGLR